MPKPRPVYTFLFLVRWGLSVIPRFLLAPVEQNFFQWLNAKVKRFQRDPTLTVMLFRAGVPYRRFPCRCALQKVSRAFTTP